MKRLRRTLAAAMIGGMCSVSGCLQEIRDVVQPPVEDCSISLGDDVLTLPCG